MQKHRDRNRCGISNTLRIITILGYTTKDIAYLFILGALGIGDVKLSSSQETSIDVACSDSDYRIEPFPKKLSDRKAYV